MNLHAALRKLLALVCLVALVPGLARAAPARPDPVALVSFTTFPANTQITVEWVTASELDVAAFTLHRATEAAPADWGAPIYTAPAVGDLVSGATYRYDDTAVTWGVRYHYLLRSVGVDGAITEDGPISGATEFVCGEVDELPLAECEALVMLYQLANGPGWLRQDGWLNTNTPCGWHGVTCWAGHVRAIDLDCNRVSGTLPAQLSDLVRLQTLSLAGGVMVTEGGRDKILESAPPHLEGWIPEDLGRLAYLQKLDLTANDLSGPIPPQLGNLAYLQILALGGNELTGGIPASLGGLFNLTQLDLTANNLTGPLPPYLGYLINLHRLSAADNDLTGPIPQELGRLANLRRLDLSHNRLTGAVPPELGDLAVLEGVSLSDNRLTGAVPSRLGRPVFLQSLDLSANPLQGPLPRSLMTLDLSAFDFADTGLCEPPDGEFQGWLGGIPDLRRTGAACHVSHAPLVHASAPAAAVFRADQYAVAPGSCTALHWQVANAQAVYLDGEGVTAQGDRIVCPPQTTDYTLSVTFTNGIVTDYVVRIAVSAGPWVGVDAAGNFYRGNPEAAVRLVEYMDFECPFCARHAMETGPQIDAAYIARGEVVELFRNFPLDIHPNAIPAAKAAYCAGRQAPDRFWLMRDWLFANRAAWTGDGAASLQFRRAALGFGVDWRLYDACIDSPAAAAQIAADLQAGKAQGIRGTPAFFINDWALSGALPFQMFADTIEKAKQGQHPTGSPTPAMTIAPPITPTRLPGTPWPTQAPPATPPTMAAPAPTATPTPAGQGEPPRGGAHPSARSGR